MPYHLRDHVYIAQFKDEVVILDTLQDTYTICSEESSQLLIDLLQKAPSFYKNEKAMSSNSSFFLENSRNINQLVAQKVIEEKDTQYPFYTDCKHGSEGVANVDWSLPLESKGVKLDLSVLGALVTLLQVSFYIKVRGFYPTIQLIRKFKRKGANYFIPSDKDLKYLAGIVNKACFLYPTRVKCLEWAITFVLLALRKNWRCNLEIGVQNYPFFAHAWVECDGKVVMDSEDLRKGLAIILSEPFRKLRT